MTEMLEIPPPPGMCQRKNCVTRTEGKPFSVIIEGQIFYCNTCGLRMKNITYFIAFREGKKEMEPVSNNGIISLFDTLNEAENASGFLGVGIATEFEGLKKIAERFKLKW